MIKHTDYDNPCHIVITKHKNGMYTLRYEDENYEFYCSKNELLEELREHVENMREEIK